MVAECLHLLTMMGQQKGGMYPSSSTQSRRSAASSLHQWKYISNIKLEGTAWLWHSLVCGWHLQVSGQLLLWVPLELFSRKVSVASNNCSWGIMIEVGKYFFNLGEILICESVSTGQRFQTHSSILNRLDILHIIIKCFELFFNT